MKSHKWVRHTIEQISVEPVRLMQGGEQKSIRFNVTSLKGGESSHTLGCDDCGLPLTEATFHEPCLSELEDQFEEEKEGGG